MDPQSIRHLHALRNFIRNLVEQAERSDGCECHRPPSLLLVGPPGAGKTYLVKQMSNVCDMPLYGVHTHQLGGPKALRNLFRQAREIDYPSLFFLDDIDSIFRDHDVETIIDPTVFALRQELYRQLGTRKLKILDPDSVHNPVKDPTEDSKETEQGEEQEEEEDDVSFDNNGIILVAATSSPWLLYKDHELLSRFRGVYLVGLPDKETRFHLIKNLLLKVQHNLTEKDIWMVADKTEGFTPSDLMLVTKALNYKQFAFLISLAGGMDELEGSSDGDSLTSSEMTESDEDETDSDQTEEANMSDGKGDVTITSGIRKLSSSSSSSKSSLSQNDNTIANLEKEWESDEEVQDLSKLKVAFSSTPKKECTNKLRALPIITDNLEGPPNEQLKDISDALNDLDEACGSTSGESRTVESPNCDNINLVDNNSLERNSPRPSKEEVEEEKPPIVPRKKKDLEADVDNCDAPKAFELHLYEPPNPLRDDNQAIDSGSDSDKEDVNTYVCRSRRVNFSDSTSMQPLSVEIGRSSSPMSYSPTAPAMPSPMEDDLIAKSLYGAVASSNILKCLLGQSDNDTNDLNLNNESPSKDKDTSHNSDHFLGLYSEEISGASDLCRNFNNLKSDPGRIFQLGLSVIGTTVGMGEKPSTNGSSSTQLTPSGSDSSGHLATDNDRDAILVTSSRDSGINKTRDSDSPTIPPSDVSTGTCNVSGETLECHSDVDDRFRNLEDDLKVRRKIRVSVSEEDEESAGEVDDDDDLRAIFSLNNLGDVTIKIITLDDVLTVVRQTPRSVSDEEIKKYTDFMVWFANVAKSACPHNARNSTRNSSTNVSLSLDSVDCNPNRSVKKRKGALKKLGRFLLKALMLLLD